MARLNNNSDYKVLEQAIRDEAEDAKNNLVRESDPIEIHRLQGEVRLADSIVEMMSSVRRQMDKQDVRHTRFGGEPGFQ